MSQSKGNPLLIHAFALMLAGAGMATYGVVGIVQARSAEAAEAKEAAVAEKPKEAEKPAEKPKEGEKPKDHKPAAAAGHGGAEDPKAAAAAAKITEANTKITTTQSDAQQVASLTTQPLGLSTLGSAATAITSLGRLKGTFGAALDFGLPALFILAGIGTIAMGVFVLQQKNWARYVGFGLLSFGLLFFASPMAGTMGNPQNTPVVGALVLLVATPVAAKFLWDLWVEKFAVAPPAEAGAH